jgi:hypothetical protein
MSISSVAKEAGKHLSQWLLKEPWHGRFITFSRDVLADIAAFLDISVSEMMTEGQNEDWGDRLLEAITEYFFELQFEEEPINIVDDYLKRRGWKESKVGRDYLQAVKSTSFSVYEVSEVKPGESITVVDKVRNLPAMEVSEILGSQCISVGQYLLAKVLNVSDRFYFSATFFVMRPNDAQEWIMDISEALEAEEDQSEQAVNAFLQESTVELLAEAVDYLLQPLPRIKNMQGESLLFTEIRFPIQDKDALVAGLESWPDLEKKEDEGESCLSWDWLEPHPTFKDAFTVLGGIQVESKWFKAKVNYKKPFEALLPNWVIVMSLSLKLS